MTTPRKRRSITGTYSEKLKDPRWQKRRLEIFKRDQFMCQRCFSEKNTLNVHHLVYRRGVEPWDADHRDLLTLCSYCHEVAEDKEVLREFRYFLSTTRLSTQFVKRIIESLSFVTQHDIGEPEMAMEEFLARVAKDLAKFRIEYEADCELNGR